MDTETLFDMETLKDSGVNPDSPDNLLRTDLEEKIVNSGYKNFCQRTSQCLNFDLVKLCWPKLSAAEIVHLDACEFCQRLVKSWPRILPILYLEPSEEETSEIKERTCLGEKHGSSQWTNNLKQHHRHCFNPIEIGKNQVVLLPRKTELTAHHKNCPHCQLVLQLHFLQHNSRFMTPMCLDAKGWRTFPIFSPNDQKQIKKHIVSCPQCRKLVQSAIRINFARDSELFNKFTAYSKLLLEAQRAKRLMQRYAGNWIYSYRFIFGKDGLFTQRHPWSIWNNEDRMLKLLGPKDLLSEEEQLYLAFLKTGRDYSVLDLDIAKAIEKIFFRKM